MDQIMRCCITLEDGRTTLEPSYVERLRKLVSPIFDRYPIRRAWL